MEGGRWKGKCKRQIYIVIDSVLQWKSLPWLGGIILSQ